MTYYQERTQSIELDPEMDKMGIFKATMKNKLKGVVGKDEQPS